MKQRWSKKEVKELLDVLEKIRRGSNIANWTTFLLGYFPGLPVKAFAAMYGYYARSRMKILNKYYDKMTDSDYLEVSYRARYRNAGKNSGWIYEEDGYKIV